MTGYHYYTNPGISIHAPHARSDQTTIPKYVTAIQFQSTLLMRGATCIGRLGITSSDLFQSTLLMRGATARRLAVGGHRIISIHAPHARSDLISTTAASANTLHFNPRSSCEERHGPAFFMHFIGNFNPRSSCEERREEMAEGAKIWEFQSTLLMRGATLYFKGINVLLDFNPRSSCEERLPLDERIEKTKNFNPRSSCEERLASQRRGRRADQEISIHAPHARSDQTSRQSCNINPFQSTLLMRGATRHGWERKGE